MIVFDLRCARSHVFEAWFASTAAYDDQRDKGMVACPLCGDVEVEKAVTAARLGGTKSPDLTPAHMKRMLAAMAQLQSRIEADCDYVGDRFAQEARAIHHGEAEERGIYGETSPDEAGLLLDEGIAVAPLPFPSRRPSDA